MKDCIIALALIVGVVVACELTNSRNTSDAAADKVEVAEVVEETVDIPSAETLAVDLIAKYEGFRAKPYKCPAGKLTIGYGFTDKVNVSKESMTEAEAKEILHSKVDGILVQVDKTLPDLNNYQRAALCSFIYNLGITNFNNSTMLKRLHEGNFEEAAMECKRWNKAGGKTLKGLVKRRIEEASMLLKK